jgi:uncharacterized protein with HEPN domain
MRPESAALADILAYGRDAIELLGDRTLAELRGDKRTQYAVLRCLEILGEAAARIPPASREQFPEVAWASVVGLRNVLIHRYDEVDLATVVGIVRRRLPELLPRIAAALEAIDRVDRP